ncbi:MAG: hypothetical protein R3Y05_02330 [bacterium]
MIVLIIIMTMLIIIGIIVFVLYKLKKEKFIEDVVTINDKYNDDISLIDTSKFVFNYSVREKILCDISDEEKNFLIKLAPSPKLMHRDFNTKDIMFQIFELDYNKETNNAKFIFQEVTKYTTIESYVQKSYGKVPVYSKPKYKSKKIYKHLTLTEEDFENITSHQEILLKEFAVDICIQLKEKFGVEYPLWIEYKIVDLFNHSGRTAILKEHTEKHDKLKEYTLNIERAITISKNNIMTIELEISKLISYVENLETVDLVKLDKKIENTKEENVKKLEKLANLREEIENAIQVASIKKENYQNAIVVNNATLDLALENNDKLKDIHEKINAMRLKLELEFKKHVINIKKNVVVKKAEAVEVKEIPESFFKLLDLPEYAYRPIVGCYVIRNRENGKCFVGQSKDIMDTLAKEFRGTTPTKKIYAEDYFTSGNKEVLFEVRIIEIYDGEDINAIQKELMAEYDSKSNGYN